MTDVAIIGGGPAGLIAAEKLAEAGLAVSVFERMPSVGRKLLIAGRGGLNLTHSEPLETFLTRYGPAAARLEPALRAFPPDALRAWAHGLGEETFVGSSRRVFPKSFKASPLLRAWLRKLDGLGVHIHTRHAWTGWGADGALTFATDRGTVSVEPKRATLLALGGASWPKLGADGSWVPLLAQKGIATVPLRPANSGVRVAWTDVFRERFAGQPVKRIALSIEGQTAEGEMIVTRAGLEGGAVYGLSAAIRRALDSGRAVLEIDLKPDLSRDGIVRRLSAPSRKGETLSNVLRKALSLSAVQTGLLRESAGPDLPRDPAALAALIKAAPLTLDGTEGLARAISTAGGIALAEVSEDYELRKLPGTFVAGEMLDWEAPTGGYLLQACFATGVAAADGILSEKP